MAFPFLDAGVALDARLYGIAPRGLPGSPPCFPKLETKLS